MGAISVNDEKLYIYIVSSFLFSCIPLFLVLVIGVALNMFTEGFIMILPFLLIRKFSGGFHFKSQYTCLLFSCILLTSFLLIIKIILKYESFVACSFAVYLAVIILCLNSPIDSKERQLSINEKKWFKAVTVSLSLLFLIVYSILVFYSRWTSGISLGIGIVIPAFLQLPCILLKTLKNDY